MKPFSSELGIAENVPIFDGVIDYDFQYINKIYIYIIRNYLYIKTMQYNPITLFLMRAGGVIVNDIPKIYCNDPTSSDH